MKDSIRISILGASGYSGAELISLLLAHPHVRIDRLFANNTAGKRLDEVFPRFAKRFEATFERFSPEAVYESDCVFIALPSGEAMNLVPELLAKGKRVIDLGGDFRLPDSALYQRYYKREHTAEKFLGSAVYGLSEWHRREIASANFIANPGCYPTSILLPLLPLLKAGVIEPKNIAIHSLSGVSGAGKSSSLEMSFAEVNESVRAYKVGDHQHIPEIKTILQSVEPNVSFSFTPHLAPITRGIYTTITAQLRSGVLSQKIAEIFHTYYADEPFIRVFPAGIPDLKNVVRTNCVDIGFHADEENGTLTICSAIDNLVKGAAGQAIQNMNIMFGSEENAGLTHSSFS